MVRYSIFIKTIIGFIVILIGTIKSYSQSFPDSYDTIPVGYTGRVFKLSQSYPKALPASETQPWLKIDFKIHPLEYLQCVYEYVLEGNVESDWIPQNNAIRKWYHTPWMHWNNNPDGIVTGRREFISGLTRERDSRPHELHENQYNSMQNWAIGMYNPAGGYIIGQVWKNPQHPNPSAAHFPYGTVAAKLLYTEADSTTVPYLNGAPEREAYVYPNASETKQRVIKKLRLLQFDIAVRDARADDASGWVFGTYVYDGSIENADPWQRMLPVGISWGNDAGVTPANVAGSGLHQTFINPKTKAMLKLGWAGRLNGPVDNPNSSCISCHSTAAYPMLRETNPDDNMSEAERLHWFNKNVHTREAALNGTISLDFSLQLSTGIKNFYEWKKVHSKQSSSQRLWSKIYMVLQNQMWIPLLLLIVTFFIIGKYKPGFFSYENKSMLPVALLILRISIGILFIVHGYPKLMNGPAGWVRLGQSMANFDIYSYPMVWGFMAAIAEFAGGLLLVLGFWFKPACIFLIITMCVASLKHISAGDSFSSASHAFELLFVFIFLLMIGAGRYSLDAIIYSNTNKGKQ